MRAYQNKPIDGVPSFPKTLEEIAAEVQPNGALVVWDEEQLITYRQRNWYRGVCLKALSDWNGDTIDEWDDRLKAMCGKNILPKEKIWINRDTILKRLSIKPASKRQMSRFIEQILSEAVTQGWIEHFGPPDPELRRT